VIANNTSFHPMSAWQYFVIFFANIYPGKVINHYFSSNPDFFYPTIDTFFRASMRNLLVSHPRGNLPRIQDIEIKKFLLYDEHPEFLGCGSGITQMFILKSLQLTVSATVLFCQDSKNRKFSSMNPMLPLQTTFKLPAAKTRI
jgi:hypothetical protein